MKKEHKCNTCTWWWGNETDKTAFCDEKNADTHSCDHCPQWQGAQELSDHLTEAQMQELRKLTEAGCSDSKVRDFCEDNGVSPRAVFHQIAEWDAPEQCKGCAHVVMRPNMPPCSSCARSHTKDYYRPILSVSIK